MTGPSFLSWSALVFCLTAVSDYVWTLYIRRAAEGKALSASFYSGFLILGGAVTTISYVNNIWLVIPTALGGFIGTFFAVRWDRKE